MDLPVVGQHLVQVFMFVGLNAFKDIIEPFELVNAILLAAWNEGIHGCCHLAALWESLRARPFIPRPMGGPHS